MQYPLKSYRLGLLFNAPYGSVLSKVLGKRHQGVDLLPDEDDDVFPMAEGNVTRAVMGNTACGGQVDIEYFDSPVTSRYCHLKQLDVKVGDTVGLNHVVGIMGATGVSYPRGYKHLHWVTWHMGTLTDPLSLVLKEDDLLNKVNSLFRSVWGRQPLPKESHYFQKRVVQDTKTKSDLLDKMKYWHSQPRFRFIWEMQKAGFF